MKRTFSWLGSWLGTASSIALMSILATTAASAENGDTIVQHHTVSTQGLDLSTAHGVEALHQRIRHAADAVCRGDDWMTLAELAAMDACRTQAIADAETTASLMVARAQARAPELAMRDPIGGALQRPASARTADR